MWSDIAVNYVEQNSVHGLKGWHKHFMSYPPNLSPNQKAKRVELNWRASLENRYLMYKLMTYATTSDRANLVYNLIVHGWAGMDSLFESYKVAQFDSINYLRSKQTITSNDLLSTNLFIDRPASTTKLYHFAFFPNFPILDSRAVLALQCLCHNLNLKNSPFSVAEYNNIQKNLLCPTSQKATFPKHLHKGFSFLKNPDSGPTRTIARNTLKKVFEMTNDMVISLNNPLNSIQPPPISAFPFNQPKWTHVHLDFILFMLGDKLW
jgi:hypothetical protein